MTSSIAFFQDDFSDGVIAPAWSSGYASGSATIAETGGQMRATLPSSVAGAHTAGYQTVNAWDMTGAGCYINIGTMVATGVAAAATFQVIVDGSNLVQWYQQSNTINVQKVVAGAATGLYSATWSATTYKYLRISESGGTLTFWSSTNGTSWTSRATLANPFALTGVAINIGASCGNVASPGSFRVDDFNITLPAPSSTWRYTTADWSISNRLRPVTIASTANAQGCIVTADTMDSADVLGGTLHYYAGPLGSSSGGYLALTEYASLALAQASAFLMPTDGRLDLPAMVDARYMRLYHRSTDASAHTLREFVPRRIVQADDIEAESIRAINIAAGAVTADKIFVINLQAVSAQMGALQMDGIINIATTGGIYQGTGTFASPTTGLKIFNSGGIGKISTYNTAVEQVTFDTDGRLKAGAGNVVLDATGIKIVAQSYAGGYNALSALDFVASLGGARTSSVYGTFTTGVATGLFMESLSDSTSAQAGVTLTAAPLGGSGLASASIQMLSEETSPAIKSSILFSAQAHLFSTSGVRVGGTSGVAADGEISTSGSVGLGVTPATDARLFVKGQGATSATYAMFAQNSTPTQLWYVRNDGAGYLLAASWTYGSDERLKEKVVKSDRGLAHLRQIEAKKFDYKDGAKDQLGFLAADVQAVMPELVMPIDLNDASPTPLLGMLTTSLIPVLVSAVQELSERIEALEAK